MNREAQLRQVYQGKFEDRPRFDGGGYVDYASMPSSAQYYTTDGSGGVTPTMAPITVTPSSYTPQSQAPVTLNAADTAGIAGIGSPVTTDQAQQAADGLAGTTAAQVNSMSTQSSLQGTVAKALAALGLGGGNSSNKGILTALNGILGAYGAYKNVSGKGTSAPTFAAPALFGGAPGTAVGSQSSGASTGWGPAGGYNYANYPASSGYAARTQTQSAPKASYYTYGSGPESQFFQQVNPSGGPITPVTQRATGGSIKMAAGGALGVMAPQAAPPTQPAPQPPGMPPNSVAPSTMSQRMQAAKPAMLARGGQPGALQAVSHGSGPEHGSRYIQGPGDGTSDSIEARLAKGEYVMDAQTVSMLGNGDNEAGAQQLDNFRKKLREHKGGALSKGKMAPNAKPIEHYMGAK